MSEVKFEPFQKVLVRDCENERWKAGFFSHMATYTDRPIYVTTGLAFYECVPYEGNERLLGTTDSPTPPEPEFKWGDHVEVRDNTSVEWRKAVYIKTIESDNFPYIVIVWDNSTDTTLNFKYRYCRHADW